MRTHSRMANDAWEALLTAHAVLMKRFAAEDIWGDLTMREYDVLYTLSKCPTPVRMAELNRHVLLSQPALSRMVDRLVERGLIRRTDDPADGRGVRLALTETGRDLQHSVGGRHAIDVARAVGGLADEELEQLEAICRKLAAGPAETDPEQPAGRTVTRAATRQAATPTATPTATPPRQAATRQTTTRQRVNGAK